MTNTIECYGCAGTGYYPEAHPYPGKCGACAGRGWRRLTATVLARRVGLEVKES